MGNTDTVTIKIRTKSWVNGKYKPDPIPDEVNLYGVPPQGDLDLRIIQRTDTNCFDGEFSAWWLYGSNMYVGSASACRGDLNSYKQNTDFKAKHVSLSNNSNNKYGVRENVLQIKAIHYPVNLYISTHRSNAFYALFKQNGFFVEGSIRNIPDVYSYHNPLYTANSEDENFLINFNYVGDIIKIRDVDYRITISPNPSIDYIFVRGIENEELLLLDIDGNFICSFFISEDTYKLDISNLCNGVYFIVNTDKQAIGKFIKGGKQ